jgi:DNA (cytosine-5)-methyltransferase 1
MEKLKLLDLFSGIGGFSLGLERTGGFETVGFCEIDPFCQKVLRKHWPNVPIYEDVRTIDAIPANVISGGYPCQPFSTAGKRGGAEDDRHLWPEMYRIIKAGRPEWVVAENVAGHISMGLDTVLSDLECAGYAWWTFVIPACALDARHRRDRVWIIANAKDERTLRGSGEVSQAHGRQDSGLLSELDNTVDSQTLANANGIGREGRNSGRGIAANEDGASARSEAGRSIQSDAAANPIGGQRSQRGKIGRMGWEEQIPWPRVGPLTSEPLVCRGAHGIPSRMDRLKSLGNSVVPQIPELIGRAILQAHYNRG